MKIKLNYNVKSSKRNYFSAADLSKFRFANKLIKRGNISAKDVNKLLNFSNIKIGQDQLDKLINKPRLIFFDLSRDTMKTPEFLQSLGTYRSKIQVPLWSKVGFDHPDYPIKNKLLTDMVNRDSEKDDF
jgi:hypothetical protein